MSDRDRPLWEAAVKFADAQGRSFSDVVADALRTYLVKEDRDFAHQARMRLAREMQEMLERELEKFKGKGTDTKTSRRRGGTRRQD